MSVTHRERDFSDMRDRDLGDRDNGGDREISLGTPTLLGIFFALALICAAFFGFGYSLGRRSTPATLPSATASSQTLSDAFKSFKPSPAASESSTSVVPPPDAADPSPASHAKPSPAAAAIVVPAAPAPGASARPFNPDAAIVGDPAPARATASPAAHPVIHPAPNQGAVSAVPQAAAQSSIPTAAPAPAGSIVQVSAFRRQEDADMVASALRRKGYTVFIRQEPQDKYLHVQLGPYGSKKEAEAMKDRLSTDGFNAIVK